jgi:Cdc6-like AAA superfamily ATPase
MGQIKSIFVKRSCLQFDLSLSQSSAELLEQRARQATTDVNVSMARITSALEARRKELLDAIDHSKLMKLAALKQRNQGLKYGIFRLSRSVEKLYEAINCKSLSNNPFNIIIRKDLTLAEVLIDEIKYVIFQFFDI